MTYGPRYFKTRMKQQHQHQRNPCEKPKLQEKNTKKEWIVIYTREDTSTRNILDTQAIIDAFDTDRYNAHIQRYMPIHFYEQVAMFGMADLLIAPNMAGNPMYYG